MMGCGHSAAGRTTLVAGGSAVDGHMVLDGAMVIYGGMVMGRCIDADGAMTINGSIELI